MAILYETWKKSYFDKAIHIMVLLILQLCNLKTCQYLNLVDHKCKNVPEIKHRESWIESGQTKYYLVNNTNIICWPKYTVQKFKWNNILWWRQIKQKPKTCQEQKKVRAKKIVLFKSNNKSANWFLCFINWQVTHGQADNLNPT